MNLYRALQWADTAFPSGRYTLSHGLEGLVSLGVVGKQDDETLTEVTEDMLRHSFGPVDLVAHFRTWEATTLTDIIRVDATVEAARPTFSARRGSVRVGKQMLLMASRLGLSDALLDAYAQSVASRDLSAITAHGHSPVAMALVHRAAGQDAEAAALIEAYGFVAAIASAAVRLQVTDFIGAQQLVTRMQPVTTQAIDKATSTPLADLGACTPLLDIASARHETAPARLFIT